MNTLELVSLKKGYNFSVGFFHGEYTARAWKWKTYRNIGKVCKDPKCGHTIIDGEMADIIIIGGSSLNEVIENLIKQLETK